MMHVQLINLPKQKTWGYVTDLKHPDHFYTGYVGYDWRSSGNAKPEERMNLGQNVVITADFKINSMSRGRSAANFSGTFRDHPLVEYEFGMQSMLQIIQLIQSGEFMACNGHISGQWTFAKQGASIFLKPYVGE